MQGGITYEYYVGSATGRVICGKHGVCGPARSGYTRWRAWDAK